MRTTKTAYGLSQADIIEIIRMQLEMWAGQPLAVKAIVDTGHLLANRLAERCGEDVDEFRERLRHGNLSERFAMALSPDDRPATPVGRLPMRVSRSAAPRQRGGGKTHG